MKYTFFAALFLIARLLHAQTKADTIIINPAKPRAGQSLTVILKLDNKQGRYSGKNKKK